jgi:poly-gamma-glutamate synthesis protein (capsule biosynthesis protein)
MMPSLVTLFLCGDLMTGRGIDQIMPVSNTPLLLESHVRDARTYVALAEKRNGPFPMPLTTVTSGATPSTSWLVQPAARIVNLDEHYHKRRFLHGEFTTGCIRGTSSC